MTAFEFALEVSEFCEGKRFNKMNQMNLLKIMDNAFVWEYLKCICKKYLSLVSLVINNGTESNIDKVDEGYHVGIIVQFYDIVVNFVLCLLLFCSEYIFTLLFTQRDNFVQNVRVYVQ